MQAFFTLSRAVTIGLAISSHPTFQYTPPITTANLLQVVDFWQNTTIPTPIGDQFVTSKDFDI